MRLQQSFDQAAPRCNESLAHGSCMTGSQTRRAIESETTVNFKKYAKFHLSVRDREKLAIETDLIADAA